MAPYAIRTVGDPVLRTPASPVTEIDGKLVRLVHDMITTMYEAPGVGLAAPQIGVQKRLFVYDTGDGSGARVVINPTIDGHRGEWLFDEGCLSVPGLYWEIVRPKEVHLTGIDLDGNPIEHEADEYLARVFQHECDHLDGVLLLERLDEEQKLEAKRALRDVQVQRTVTNDVPLRERSRFRLPGRS